MRSELLLGYFKWSAKKIKSHNGDVFFEKFIFVSNIVYTVGCMIYVCLVVESDSQVQDKSWGDKAIKIFIFT